MIGRDRPIWNRDSDKLADPEILQILARGTGIQYVDAFNTTLAAYNAWIYLEHNPYGNSKWILPLGVYHRFRRGNGIQYCPKCLANDREPYFRRKWRLGFVTVCAEHAIELLDGCPACRAPVCYHRREMGRRNSLPDGNMELCFRCGQNLSRVDSISISDEEMDFHRYLAKGLSNGWIEAPGGNPVYAHLYFDVLHQIMKLLVSKRSRELGKIVGQASGIPEIIPSAGHVEIEHLTISARRQLLRQAQWLLTDWPNRFISLCCGNRVWSTWLLRDMTTVPWWFASVVQRELHIRFGAADSGHNRLVKNYRSRNFRGRPGAL